jgi:hypothetical protein
LLKAGTVSPARGAATRRLPRWIARTPDTPVPLQAGTRRERPCHRTHAHFLGHAGTVVNPENSTQSLTIFISYRIRRLEE